MKRLYIPFLITGLFSLFLVSCYYDNEEALYPVIYANCDTTIVTFSGTIVPILNKNCYTCHSNINSAANGNNIHLEDYSDVVANSARITPAIKHTGSASPMPKNGSKIPQCSITQWDIWVRNGMVNN
jgi:hypothetical protein